MYQTGICIALLIIFCIGVAVGAFLQSIWKKYLTNGPDYDIIQSESGKENPNKPERKKENAAHWY